MDTLVFTQKLRKVLLFSGYFNIVFTLPLAIPVISNYYLIFLNGINNTFHLGGNLIHIPHNPLYSFFINTAGIDLTLIGLIILYAAKDPVKRKGLVLLNTIGRMFFVGIVIYYVYMNNIAPITIFFAMIDFILIIIFFYFLYHLKYNKQLFKVEV